MFFLRSRIPAARLETGQAPVRCGHHQSRPRSGRGFSIAEAAASMGLLLPLTIVIIFVVLEASYAYLIKHSMSQAAQRAARDLSIAYGQDPSIASNRTMQNSVVFDKIRIPNMVNDSQQFEDPVFATSAETPVVSVSVRYLSNQFGLPRFPNPDPLNLGAGFVIRGSATYRLE